MIRVLVADDHTIVRDGLRQLLADTPDLVVAGEAANGDELLARVQENDWNVLVLDISMPGRSGLDLIRQLKRERPGLPILVFSMHQEEQYAARALRAGASGYLTKEADGTLLVAVIRKVAQGSVYLSEKMTRLLLRELQPGSERPPHETLTDREFQIFRRIVAGGSVSVVADELSLSVKTVSTHKAHILQKMGMSSTAELVRYAVENGLVEKAPR
ncbi:response regulator transcription factor [Aromatoleum evansii]|uniref:response regulator transcription factor n=1 Tax=Aromatoleum evansii TaxID=59406 RepID=UPI00145F00A1|nr:response regulator transcription factor [Aromatoleum evansii]NMG31611.1 response regulator [Aromatoleum evansii]